MWPDGIFFWPRFLLPSAPKSWQGEDLWSPGGRHRDFASRETPHSWWRPWPWSEKGVLVQAIWVGPASASGDGARNNGHHQPKDTGEQLQEGVVSQGARNSQRHVGQGEEAGGPSRKNFQAPLEADPVWIERWLDGRRKTMWLGVWHLCVCLGPFGMEGRAQLSMYGGPVWAHFGPGPCGKL